MGFKRRRSALVIGLAFILLAAVYFTLSHDAGGATTLTALGIAMSLLTFALVVGTPDDV
jgi:hypothetical protein